METGEVYACKRIAKENLKTDMDVDDVRREVEIMRRLPKHPNIVSFKEAYEDEEACYLVIEPCEGGKLFDRIVAKGHYTERAAAKTAKTILETVKVCHENGVIHRDLKPKNFLFADAGENSQLKMNASLKSSAARITWRLRFSGGIMDRKLMFGVLV